MTIALVGGGVATWKAAAELRRCGHIGELVVVGGGAELPYDRPPLSKDFLTTDASPTQIALVAPAALASLGIRHLHNNSATALDPERGILTLDDGSNLDFDALVIATGTVSVHPRIPGATKRGVHCLRSLDDALRLRDALLSGPAVAVVGGGFIGCEFAASCRKLGLAVTLVEAAPHPLARQMGAHFGNMVSKLHREAGVDLRCGLTVSEVLGSERAEAIALSDGTTAAADLVLIGVGSRPQDGWLTGSGIDVDDGVVVDDCGWTGVGRIYAAGDIARWHSRLMGRSVRVEHWTGAVEQGRMVARNLLDPSGRVAINQVPYFWTDQYAMRAQVVGFPTEQEHICLGPDEGMHAVAYEHDDRLVGVLAVNWPRLALAARRTVGTEGCFRSTAADLVAAAS